MYYMKLYACSLAGALILDAIWLGVVARGFYAKNLRHLLAENVNWWAAGAFYALHAAGIVWFCVLPAVREESLPGAVLNAAALGLLMYATYDLTNQATLKDWPLSVTIVDIVWGATISAVVGFLGYQVGSRFLAV